MAPELLVLGHANIDIILHIDRVPARGESRPVQDRRTVYGGTACNIARHAAKLGCPTTLWARVGPDFPVEWRASLEDDGVDVTALNRTGNRTPTCYIFTDAEGHQSYCMDQGAMASMVEHPPAMELLAGRRFIHFATGQPEAYLPLANAANKQGLHVAFDPGQEIHFAYDAKSFEAMLECATTLFLNETELAVALRFMRYGDPAQLLDHVTTVVITRGDQGASLYQDGFVHHEPAEVVAALDPTGAGDALRGGWYAALHRNENVVEALRYGMKAAAFQVQQLGPQSVVPMPSDL